MGDDFIKKNSNFRIFFSFHFVLLTFSCYYYSINLKRQSEHSGLRPDMSSLVSIYSRFKIQCKLFSGIISLSFDLVFFLTFRSVLLSFRLARVEKLE